MDTSLLYNTIAPWPGQDDGDIGRQRRGLAIAALCNITPIKIGYKVPSQSGRGDYVVCVDSNPDNDYCACPDYEARELACKHIYAARLVKARGEVVAANVVAGGVDNSCVDAFEEEVPVEVDLPYEEAPISPDSLQDDLVVPEMAHDEAIPSPEPAQDAEGPPPTESPVDQQGKPAVLTHIGWQSAMFPDLIHRAVLYNPADGTVAQLNDDSPIPTEEPPRPQKKANKTRETPSTRQKTVQVEDTGPSPFLGRHTVNTTSEADTLHTPDMGFHGNPWIHTRRAYDQSQIHEKENFHKLLAELCAGVPQPPPQATGRPNISMADMVFSSVEKVYSGFSLRRFQSDLREAQKKGYIYLVPAYTTVCKYMGLPEMTPILMDLITASAIPMYDLETNFAIDSSGFSTCRFVSWFNKKHNRVVDNREWVKGHISCGTKTKIVTAVEISGWQAHDTTFFEPLLERTARFFNVQAVMADKAYSSHHNLAYSMLAGAKPYIPFKSNTRVPTEDDSSAWAAMYHYFRLHKGEFYRYYNQRNAVETAFSMVKAKFGDYIRSKNTIPQINETLCKFLCHNIVEVNKATYTLGLDVGQHRR